MALRHSDSPNLAGRFEEKDFGHLFEYIRLDPDNPHHAYDISIGATHQVYVGPWCTPQPDIDRGTRAAIVKRTVAIVAVDEDDMGRPVWEKWQIKKHMEYTI